MSKFSGNPEKISGLVHIYNGSAEFVKFDLSKVKVDINSSAQKTLPYVNLGPSSCDSGGKGSTGCSTSSSQCNGCSVSCGAGYYACCERGGVFYPSCVCIKMQQ